jgi:hypothetical protein
MKELYDWLYLPFCIVLACYFIGKMIDLVLVELRAINESSKITAFQIQELRSELEKRSMFR